VENGKTIIERKTKKSSKLIITLIGLPLVLLSAGGVFGWKFLPNNLPEEKVPREGDEQQKNDIGPIFSFDTFVVNLADRDAQRYVKIEIKLEMDTAKLKPELENRAPQVQDIIIEILSMKRQSDLTSFKGKDNLRSEIIQRINNVLLTGSIKAAYFTEFITQ
jgi:flagellar FliL protein